MAIVDQGRRYLGVLGSGIQEIREVDYALVSFGKGATEDNETVHIKEILEDFKKEGSAVLLISRELL